MQGKVGVRCRTFFKWMIKHLLSWSDLMTLYTCLNSLDDLETLLADFSNWFRICSGGEEYIIITSLPIRLLKYIKGGCTRFEVEHISCNLLLYIGKTE